MTQIEIFEEKAWLNKKVLSPHGASKPDTCIIDDLSLISTRWNFSLEL